MVDEWILVTPAIGNGMARIQLMHSLFCSFCLCHNSPLVSHLPGIGGTPESMKTSDVVDEEEGLPSPPLDEGAFFASQPMELSQVLGLRIRYACKIE